MTYVVTDGRESLLKRLTLMLIPDDAKGTKQVSVPHWLLKAFMASGLLASSTFGYLIFDYLQLRSMRTSYKIIEQENAGLRGEAQALVENLEEVKQSLDRVRDYTTKLTDITQIKVKKISKKTGIGPLTPEEYKIAKGLNSDSPGNYIPAGLSPDTLSFRTAFDRLYDVGRRSNQQAFTLQHILSKLSKQRSLLASIPSVSPVNGWVTSGFGHRISPFTGQRTMHMGLDVASPIGTPIYAPADGVVIFVGKKSGFGNFIMIAHGYGIVSRYGHNAQNMVQPGQRVKRGEQIATVGMSGRSTGPHLHYEILVNGRHANPRKFILSLALENLAH